MPVSQNPADWIFAFGNHEDGFIAITEKAYFDRNGYMYDQHTPFDLPENFDEVAEGVLVYGNFQGPYNHPLNAEMKAVVIMSLTSFGLQFSESLDKFLTHDPEELEDIVFPSYPRIVAPSITQYDEHVFVWEDETGGAGGVGMTLELAQEQLTRYADSMNAPPNEKMDRETLLEDALRELHAMVCGECPSLLNEDSGGNGKLSCQIESILSSRPTSPNDEYMRGLLDGLTLHTIPDTRVIALEDLKTWASEWRDTVSLAQIDLREDGTFNIDLKSIENMNVIIGNDPVTPPAKSYMFDEGWGFAYRQWQRTGSVPDPAKGLDVPAL